MIMTNEQAALLAAASFNARQYRYAEHVKTDFVWMLAMLNDADANKTARSVTPTSSDWNGSWESSR